MNHSWRVFFYYLRSWVPVLLLVLIGLLGLGWGLYSFWPTHSLIGGGEPRPQASSIIVATAPVHPTAASQATAITSVDPKLSPINAQVILLSNQARQANGCNVLLAPNPLLDLAAQRHSEDMAQRGYFDHVSPEGLDPGDRITSTGYRWSRYGENIAAGYPTAERVVEGWMNSPGHRANILNCDFQEIGVGYALRQVSGGRDEAQWTQVFATAQ